MEHPLYTIRNRSRTYCCCVVPEHRLHRFTTCTVRKLSRISFLCKLRPHNLRGKGKLSRASFLRKLRALNQHAKETATHIFNFEHTACTLRKLSRTSFMCQLRAHNLDGKELVTLFFWVNFEHTACTERKISRASFLRKLRLRKLSGTSFVCKLRSHNLHGRETVAIILPAQTSSMQPAR